MIDMIERVARALAKDDHDFENWTDFYRKKARQAIGEMREPTIEMLEAMHNGPLGAGDEHMKLDCSVWLTNMWTSGVDAVLSSSDKCISCGSTGKVLGEFDSLISCPHGCPPISDFETKETDQ